MGLGGIRTLSMGGSSGSTNLGPGNVVGAIDSTSILMSVANPGISNILSATLLLSPIGATTNYLKIDMSINGGASPGVISQIQPASGSTPGFLTAADWTTFNAKVPAARLIGTTFPLLGGGDLSADRILSMPVANGTTGGYLSASDWTAFNAKQTAISVGPVSAVSFANGATLFGPTFQLGPADFTNPGLMTTGGQTFAGNKTFVGTIAASPGTIAAVGFYLGTDVGTGFFRAAVNQFNLAVNGATSMVWGANNIGYAVPLLGPIGTTSLPTYSFAGDPDTGFYNPAANTLGAVVGSTEVSTWSSLAQKNVVPVLGSSGIVTAPAFGFIGATTMGFYISGVSNLGVAVGGVQKAYFSPNGIELPTQNAIRFQDFSGGEYVEMKAGATVTTFSMTLPTAQGATGSYLKNDGTGILSFADPNTFVGALYYLNPATSGAATFASATITILDYNVSVLDPDSAVTTGASWRYIVPTGKAGKFVVDAGLELAVQPAVGSDLEVYVNGTLACYSTFFGAALTSLRFVSRPLNLAAGDLVSLRVFQRNTTNSVNDFSGAGNLNANFLGIYRIGT